MKKNNLMYYLVITILLILFNIIAFVIPIEKNTTFWIVYVFSDLAFIMQVPLWMISFGKNDTLKNKFLGISLIYIGIFYLIIQLIVFIVFVVFPTLPVWLAIIICSIIFALSIIFVIAGKTGTKEIKRIDEKIKVKRAFIQFLQTDIEMLIENEKDNETKEALKKLAEKVRFSDPMSHEMLAELESRISSKVDEMKNLFNKKELIDEVDKLLIERNKKCKILK